MPKRLGWTVLTIGVGLLLSVGIIMYLAFSAGPQAPSRLYTDAIDAEATVSWTDEGGVTVQARSLPDALVLLGYGHARSRSWQLALWRQAALGRLSEWFGTDALPADRMVRQLSIPDGARQAWTELDTDTKSALSAFAAGLDLAVSAPDLSRGAPFLIMDVEMEPWQPWHSLAIERLFAWMSSSGHADQIDLGPATWDRAQRTLERLLSFHGVRANYVAGVYHPDQPYLALRLATGSSGIPLFVESEMDYGSGRFTGLMMPGTMVALTGRTHADAWALTGQSRRSVDTASVSNADIATRFDRIDHNGHEEIVASHRVGARLLLDSPPRSGESGRVRVLTWSGETSGTDAGIWLAALQGSAPDPFLLSRDGVRWSGGGFRVTGRPATVLQPGTGSYFVTSAPEYMSPAATVAGLPDPPPLTAWMNTTLSRAAREALQPIMPLLADSLITDARMQEAVRYLRNWNLEYGAAEPGASILETLLTHPEIPTQDGAVLRKVLQETIGSLSLRYGPDMSSWRWETVQERGVTFPGTTPNKADGGRPEERFLDKYRAVRIRAPGHPQSLVWGAPPSADSLRITSVWEGGLALNDGMLYFRRPFVEFNRFLGTFMTGDRPPETRALRRQAPDASTTFLPRD